MSWHLIIDAAVNLACIVVGVLVGYKVRWNRARPNYKLLNSVVIFIMCGLWYITGLWLHIDFVLGPIRELPYQQTQRFGVFALLALSYGLFLLLSGTGRAKDE